MNETPAASRSRILLIDDDELIAGALRSYLRGHGCRVDVACDVAAAESLMAGHSYDTVMVDPYLTEGRPGDRLALLDLVRSMQPAASLVVVTAYATQPITESLSSGRITTLMIKPRPVPELGRAALPGVISATPPSPPKGPVE